MTSPLDRAPKHDFSICQFTPSDCVTKLSHLREQGQPIRRFLSSEVLQIVGTTSSNSCDPLPIDLECQGQSMITLWNKRTHFKDEKTP